MLFSEYADGLHRCNRIDIAGKALARATMSDVPSYATRRLRPHGDSIDLTALALLHRELLNAAGLM